MNVTASSPTDSVKQARIHAVAAVLLAVIILIGTTQAIRAGGRTMNVHVPWVMNGEALRHCFGVPLVGATLLAALSRLVAAVQQRSHVFAGLAVWTATSMIYLEGLFRWTAPPPDVLDFRIGMSITFGYVPQTVAIAALVAHALILVRRRRGDGRGRTEKPK
jgi:hypothetical protein